VDASPPDLMSHFSLSVLENSLFEANLLPVKVIG